EVGTIAPMTQLNPIQISSLIYYPIKACRGCEVESINIERMGLQNDRCMMVTTPDGGFLTQREYPRLALVTPKLNDGSLELSAPNYDSLRVGIQTSSTPVLVDVWKSKGVQAIDQGEEAAQWFSDWLGTEVRLVHIADGYIRRVNEAYTVNEDDHTGFADGYPILLASEEGLADLNARLESPVPMNRFRPNIVVKGCGPFEEDLWNRIKAGDVTLAVVKPCARCEVTTIDKETLDRSKEPLKTLGKYRKQKLGAIFGQNVIPLNEGTLRLGMSVEVLS
ncbi:MAG TPA: MOSC N-terminal beta barrel domain-containing protein, partial [Anaerolineales bacterium]|nr:MOSC N-terminal beta barrel domain-containing protein [Anaerolineales bacterium]